MCGLRVGMVGLVGGRLGVHAVGVGGGRGCGTGWRREGHRWVGGCEV